MTDISRRNALGLMGASALTLATGMPARAQSSRLVVGTYGGDSQRFFTDAVTTPLLTPKGINVVIDAAVDGPRELKLQAERNLPRGSYDVIQGQASVMFRLYDQGLLDTLDPSKITGYDEIEAAIRTNYAIPQTVTARGVLYNTEFVKTPPTSYADLWSPELEGKVGLIDQHFLMAMTAASLANGGSVSDLGPGKAKLMELKKKGVKIYPSNEAFGQALSTGEIWAGIMIQSRAVMWANGGSKIGFCYPKEGTIFDWWGFGIPKNSRNKQAAYVLLNAIIADSAQAIWSVNMGTTPVTTSALAKIDSAHAAKVALPENAKSHVLKIDEEYLLKNFKPLKDWWDRDFKA